MKRFTGWFFLKTSGIIVVFLTLVFLSLEGAARFFHWWPDPLMQPDERFGFAHVPDASGWWVNIDAPCEFQTHVRINSKGLRDREYPYEKHPGVFRILVLGDSFADGLEVSLKDSFPKVLETLLNERLDASIEVINAGVWGYGNDLELLFYRLEVRKYQPDLVLLAFQSNSDVLENHQELETRYMGEVYKPFFVLKGGGLTLTNWPFPVELVEPPPPQGAVEHVKAWLAAHFRLYPVAGYFIKRRLPDLAGVLRGIGAMTAAQGNARTSEIPMAMYLYAVDCPPEWEEAWAVTEAIIARLSQEVEADGAQLAVLLLPDRHQVEEGYLDWALRTHPAMQGQAWDLDKPNQTMRRFLGEQGIPYLEMLAEFQQRARKTGRPLYYPKDGHWNVEGHRLAGELLADKLCQQGLVSCGEATEAR